MIETIVLGTAVAAILLFPKKASAHCDTPDGPVIIDGKKSLDSGDVNYSLKWINAEAEAELKHAFELCMDVRGLSDNARKVADHHFLETLVRLHRASEGAPYTGIKPAGSQSSPVIAAADESMETRSVDKLLSLVDEDKREEIKKRFDVAISKKDHDLADIKAGREYVEAYVRFVKFAAGEEHEEGENHGESHVHSC